MIRPWSFRPPSEFQHGRILLRTPSISLAVTTAARLGAAGAWRVTCCTGLGCCSGVWTLVFDCWFFRMSSSSESTRSFGFGLGGGGLGGSGFFASTGGLGGSGFFGSAFGGSGSFGFIAISSSAGLGGSGLGIRGGGRGVVFVDSGLGGPGGSPAGGGPWCR